MHIRCVYVYVQVQVPDRGGRSIEKCIPSEFETDCLSSPSSVRGGHGDQEAEKKHLAQGGWSKVEALVKTLAMYTLLWSHWVMRLI